MVSVIHPCVSSGPDSLFYGFLPSPLGRLLLVADAGGLRRIDLPGGRRGSVPAPDWREDPRALVPAIRQLNDYFVGRSTTFDLALCPHGTPFQVQVWTALLQIPFGRTCSYGELARRIGRPTASRAVGAANGANPLPIVIPCHRVIGSDGSLTGFGGGLAAKRWLLRHEAL